MTRAKLFKALNELCDNMNYEYNINSGGCCFVAATIAEQLEIYHIPFEVAFTEHPTHYAIKVSDRFINRDGYYFDEFYDWNSEYLYDTYYDEVWNDCYNRRWNLIVQTRIRALFRKYENSRT